MENSVIWGKVPHYIKFNCLFVFFLTLLPVGNRVIVEVQGWDNMIIDIKGDMPGHINWDFFYKSIDFYANVLLKEECNNVYILVELFKDYKQKTQRYAHCYPVVKHWFTFMTPRNFVIEIDGNLSKRQTGLSLAHEMVHVQQIYQGFLKLPPYHKQMTWCGFRIDTNRPEGEQPYEIEARGREEYLYECFLNKK